MGETKVNITQAGKEAGNWMQCLGPNGIFGGLDPAERESIARRARRKHFGAGELLFQEGDRCLGLHIVAAGRVRIYKSSASGREQVLAIEGPGSTVAELPVFDGGNYPASAIALEATEIMFLPREEFRAFCLERPEVALKVLAAVGGRLRKLVDLIEELSFTTVRQRLAVQLVRLAKVDGHRVPEGLAFDLPDSHQEMAHKMGTVRELVSRNLTRLSAEGLLKLDGRHIVVRDLARLEEAAGDEA
jgi:CRP/FNR family transcriptional regulator